VTGDFALLSISSHLVLITSVLDSDANKHGPDLLYRNSYPLATAPFITSGVLQQTIDAGAQRLSCKAVSVDAIGYSQETGRFRWDLEHQSVSNVLSEMAAQGRHLHRVEIVLMDSGDRERARFSIDRLGRTTIKAGSPAALTTQFILPVVEHYESASEKLSIGRADRASQQQGVVLTFPRETFSKYSDMEALCDAIRESSGLGVSIIHLNPYLQAQIMDYYVGTTVDLVVTGHDRATLIPRMPHSETSLGRICTSVLRYFGEGQISVQRLASSTGDFQNGESPSA
jgi:hypothetical protein